MQELGPKGFLLFFFFILLWREGEKEKGEERGGSGNKGFSEGLD